MNLTNLFSYTSCAAIRVIFLFYVLINSVQAQVVSCYAGTLSGAGNVDGPVQCGLTSRFNHPVAIAMDATGNLYVADRDNNLIRKISTSGIVSTLAGSGIAGNTDATGTVASFNKPLGVAVDVAGNVYVADNGNNKIRLITAAGVVTTFAGNGTSYGPVIDGPALSANFKYPTGVAVDANGNVYVADGNMIRKITGGNVSTLAGSLQSGHADGVGAAALFYGIMGIVADAADNLYVTDSHAIRKILPDGTTTTVAGNWLQSGEIDGPVASATFHSPTGIAIDAAGNLYIADALNNKIRKITLGAGGMVSILAGNLKSSSYTYGGLDGIGTEAQFYGPQGIVSTPSGTVYVADTENHMIRKISPSGQVTTIGGMTNDGGFRNGIGAGASFNSPSDITTDPAGNVYVISGEEIRTINPSGIVSTLAGTDLRMNASGQPSQSVFYEPQSIFYNKVDNNVYILQYFNDTIKKINASGVISNYFSNTIFNYNLSMAMDANGIIYLSTATNVIYKLMPDGTISAMFGSSVGYSNGTGSSVKFNYPTGLVTDIAGNVYVADAGNHSIRKITPSGLVSTLAGTGLAGALDGIGLSASFSSPIDLAIDATGNLYVAEAGNSNIRKITPGGTVTTIAGSGTTGSNDGIGTGASFNEPYGIAIAADGNLYVSDKGNNKVRKITNTVVTPTTSTLTTTVIGLGSVTPASGTFSYGSIQTLTATPATGYTFTGWSGDATGTTNPLSVTMNANKNITATFTIIYTLTTTIVGSGTVSPSSGTFNAGTTQTLTATPATGYTFTGWSGDATGTTNPLSVTMTANKNITATFTINKYTLATNVVGSGIVSPSSATFNAGTTQTLTAIPATGYTFTGWSGDATGTTNPLSITISGNKNIIATFSSISTGVDVSVAAFKDLISPNPSNNTFKVELSTPTDVDVYSLDGKLVLSYKNVSTTEFGETLQAGLYIVKAGDVYYKIIKE